MKEIKLFLKLKQADFQALLHVVVQLIRLGSQSIGEVKMEEKVQDYLRKAKEQELIKRRLAYKKFYPPNEVTKEMKQKLDYDDTKKQYFEIMPCEVTDEEFDQILKLPLLEKESKLPFILTFLGYIIFVLGFVGGISIANQTVSYLSSFNWGIALGIWAGALLVGMIFIGLGKVIELLNDLKYK
jgi:hypothetical protein